MPIEFRCSHCGKLLRTGDETVGRQAQCPECGSLTEVPGAVREGMAPPMAPLGESGEFRQAGTPGSPFATGTPRPAMESDNPYQSPYGEAAYAVPAAQRVAGPAIGLIVTAILSFIGQSLGLLSNLMTLVALGGRPPMQGADGMPMFFTPHFAVGAHVFGLAMGILVLVGALRMKKLESYSLAMAAAIVALVPCTSPCCLLGIPFGIWALVVLNDASVKAAFRS